MTRVVRACLGSPGRMAATAAAITPGMHLLLSAAVERRRVTWASDYPAVLVGDPLLAISTGLAARVAGPQAVLAAAPLRRPLAPVAVGAAALFGAWQLRDEVRRGVYSRQQAVSPSKLWHQFVVYPALTPLVAGALLSATSAALAPEATRSQRVETALAWAGAAGWAVLALDAVRHPRRGHGTFDWSRLRR
ncbi:MAG: hypothetical protein JXA67_00950 [Micromonosporaceae bacterium]|nr:hypothetical protein [Micromonosporaceae bacterium]